LLLDIDHILAEISVGIHKIAYGITGMVHSGVVLTSKLGAYGCEGCLCKIAAKVHGNLSCLHDFPLPCLGQELVCSYIEVIAD